MSVLEVTVGNNATAYSDTEDSKREEQNLSDQIEFSKSAEQHAQYAIYSAKAEAILLEDLSRESTAASDNQQIQKQQISLLPGLDIIV